MTKIVVGQYRTTAEAESKVVELLQNGFPGRSISVEGKRSDVSPLKNLGIPAEYDNRKPDGIEVSVNDTLAPNYLIEELKADTLQPS